MKSPAVRSGVAIVSLMLGSMFMATCGPTTESMPEPPSAVTSPQTPLRRHGITANNVFLYYDDVERANTFYTTTLGLQTAADYGFAKILRVAPTSFITLVDAKEGMHSTDEPKSVAIAFVTDQLDAWHAYLSGAGVPMRAPFEPVAGGPHDGFVAFDPEGYYLEFERFNPHAENERLLPMLQPTATVLADAGSEVPSGLGFKATILWLYYRDLAASQRFYEDRLGFELIVDQGWAKIYRTSTSGYVGLVDGARGMHEATDDKAVTVSFLTDDISGWFAYVRDSQVFELRTKEMVSEGGKVDVFVGYDPEHYFLEFDMFVEHPDNVTLLEMLRQP